ncbi:MAG: DUF1800 family protein [Planctomycetota bacterium]|nr:DUF1800 family protein [Planctomycetota bacterium]
MLFVVMAATPGAWGQGDSFFREGGRFIRADANADGETNISDAIFTLAYLFTGGPPPSCLNAADSNADLVVDVSDGVYSLLFLFSGGAPPPAPGAESCGVDAAANRLSCDSFPPCGDDDFRLISHVLHRITFGPTEELYTRIQTRQDLIDYISEQLDAPQPYDQAVHEPEFHQEIERLGIGYRADFASGNIQPRRLESMLLLDAVRSEWQLLHVISRFWNNHFHTQIDALRDNFFRGAIGGNATRTVTWNDCEGLNPAAAPVDWIWNDADANSSGTITEAEWNVFRREHPSAMPWTRFRRADRESGGGMDRCEFANRRNVGYWKYGFGNDQFGVAADLERREYNALRRRAFGTFRSLVEQHAKSPAQVIYLNNFENKIPEPNENYAREILELFVLGADRFYIQRDIEEVARIFTGWNVAWVERAGGNPFNPADVNFIGRPGRQAFSYGGGLGRAAADRLVLRERHVNGRNDGGNNVNSNRKFPDTRFWDDDVYVWAFRLRTSEHDWGRKSLFVRSRGGVDSLGNPLPASARLDIPGNLTRNIGNLRREFDGGGDVGVGLLDRIVSFRDCRKSISSKLLNLLVTDDLSQLEKSADYPVPEDVRDAFNSVDSNRDGVVTFVPGRAPDQGPRSENEWGFAVPGALPNGRPPAIFDSLDANGDGVLDLEEYREPDLLLDAMAAWADPARGTIRDVLEAILFSDEFLSLKFYRAKVKDPFELAVSTVRVLDGDWQATSNGTNLHNHLQRTTDDVEAAGQELFNFGDPTGESEMGFDWMHTIGLLERLKFVNRGANPVANADRRFLGRGTGAAWSPTGNGSIHQRWNLGSNNPRRAVDFLSLLILGGDLLDEQRELARQAYATATNANTRLRAATAYILSLPQFQKQ